MSLKNPLILAGIEPATFRFVAQHLNHCATAVPSIIDLMNAIAKHKIQIMEIPEPTLSHSLIPRFRLRVGFG